MMSRFKKNSKFQNLKTFLLAHGESADIDVPSSSGDCELAPLKESGLGRTVAVLGAGPAGVLTAIFLARRGYAVTVLEARPDPREQVLALSKGSRVVGIAMSQRSLRTIRRAGVPLQAILDCGVEIKKMIYKFDKTTIEKPLDDLSFYTVSRDELVKRLIDQSEKISVQFQFEHKCENIDVSSNTVLLNNEGQSTSKQVDFIVCADGAFSVGRRVIQRELKRFNYSQNFYRHGYKTIMIENASEKGFERDSVYFYAGPDGWVVNGTNITNDTINFTVCLPYEGKYSLQMFEKDQIKNFFSTYLPDLYDNHPAIEEEFKTNPIGDFVSIRCSQHHYGDRLLLIGDAAHAVVPFIGQGMNLAIEDTDVFNSLLDQYEDDWSEVLPRYSDLRVPEANALSDFALGNYEFLNGSNMSLVLRRNYNNMMHDIFPKRYPPELETFMLFTDMRFSQMKKIQQAHNQWWRLGRL